MVKNIDTVTLRGLHFNLTVGLDAWGREKAQPVEISLEVSPWETFEAAATRDDVSQTLDYGKLYKKIMGLFEANTTVPAVDTVARGVLSCLASMYCWTKIEVYLPKGLLRAEQGLKYVVDIDRSTDNAEMEEEVIINGIRCACIIGVNPHERLVKQIIVVNIRFGRQLKLQGRELQGFPVLPHIPYNDMVRVVTERVEGSSFKTVEALATAIAQLLTVDFRIDAVTVEVEKPHAIAAIEAAGIRVHRKRDFFTERDFWKVKYP